MKNAEPFAAPVRRRATPTWNPACERPETDPFNEGESVVVLVLAEVGDGCFKRTLGKMVAASPPEWREVRDDDSGPGRGLLVRCWWPLPPFPRIAYGDLAQEEMTTEQFVPAAGVPLERHAQTRQRLWVVRVVREAYVLAESRQLALSAREEIDRWEDRPVVLADEAKDQWLTGWDDDPEHCLVYGSAADVTLAQARRIVEGEQGGGLS